MFSYDFFQLDNIWVVHFPKRLYTRINHLVSREKEKRKFKEKETKKP